MGHLRDIYGRLLAAGDNRLFLWADVIGLRLALANESSRWDDVVPGAADVAEEIRDLRRAAAYQALRKAKAPGYAAYQLYQLILDAETDSLAEDLQDALRAWVIADVEAVPVRLDRVIEFALYAGCVSEDAPGEPHIAAGPGLVGRLFRDAVREVSPDRRAVTREALLRTGLLTDEPVDAAILTDDVPPVAVGFRSATPARQESTDDDPTTWDGGIPDKWFFARANRCEMPPEPQRRSSAPDRPGGVTRSTERPEPVTPIVLFRIEGAAGPLGGELTLWLAFVEGAVYLAAPEEFLGSMEGALELRASGSATTLRRLDPSIVPPRLLPRVDGYLWGLAGEFRGDVGRIICSPSWRLSLETHQVGELRSFVERGNESANRYCRAAIDAAETQDWLWFLQCIAAVNGPPAIELQVLVQHYVRLLGEDPVWRGTLRAGVAPELRSALERLGWLGDLALKL